MGALSIYTEPLLEPVTLEEAKEHLRVSGTEDNNYITNLITAARLYAERYTNRALITQTWDYYLDGFSGLIELPKPPLISITSIVYTDTAGESQTLDASYYSVDIYSQKARLIPAYGRVWPSTRDVMNSVHIRMVTGYGASPENVPMTIRQGMLVFIADAYDNRESLIKGVTVSSSKATVDILLDGSKVIWMR